MFHLFYLILSSCDIFPSFFFFTAALHSCFFFFFLQLSNFIRFHFYIFWFPFFFSFAPSSFFSFFPFCSKFNLFKIFYLAVFIRFSRVLHFELRFLSLSKNQFLISGFKFVYFSIFFFFIGFSQSLELIFATSFQKYFSFGFNFYRVVSKVFFRTC